VWQADGWGWRARIGLLTPHADIVPESEFRAMALDGVSIHAARVPLGVYLREGPWIGQLPLTTCELLPTHRG
jgi:hypothetical protein